MFYTELHLRQGCGSSETTATINRNINGCLPEPLLLASLLDVANDLFCKGKPEDSLSLLASAISICKNSKGCATKSIASPSTTTSSLGEQISHQLRWGVEKLRGVNVNTNQSMNMQSDLPDTYHEDECDVGPRPFRLPIFPEAALFDCEGDRHRIVIVYAEVLLMYNKALIYHSSSEYGEAMRLYEAVALTVSKLLPEGILCPVATPVIPPTTLLTPDLYKQLLELCMRVQNNMGQITYMLGLEDTAMNHFETSLLSAKRRMEAPVTSLNTLRLDYATVISNWCRAHWMSGDIHDRVHQGLEEVLRIRSCVLGWDHVDVASAHFNLGVAEYARNCPEAALSHLFSYLKVAAHQAKEAKEEAISLKVDAKQQQQQLLDPIPALIYILLVKNEHKDDEVSQELVRGLRSLQEKRADVGPQGPEVASVLNFIGTLLFHQKDYEHALLFFQEELRLEENLVFHEDDVSISVTCNNIGRILQELSRLNEAKYYYHRALKAHYGDRVEEWCAAPQQQTFCPLQWNIQHLQDLPHSTMQLYSAVWYNLGLIHDKLGSYGEATNAFKVSLGLRRAMLGPNHADVACLLYNIGVLQMEQQMLQDATASFQEALRIRQMSPSTGHLNDAHVVQTLKKLAALHKSKGNIAGALETLFEILNIQKVSADTTTSSNPSSSTAPTALTNHSRTEAAIKNKDVGVTLRDIAELYHAEGKLALAVTLAQESIEVFRGSQIAAEGTMEYVAYTEELVAGLLLLGSLYHEHCEPSSARQLFQEASAMIRQVSSYFPTSTELDAMQEVTEILAACHCAPVA